MIRVIILVFVITGYCNDSCGVVTDQAGYAITASGDPTRQGVIACPPWMPFGTKITLGGMGRFTCEDRGGCIDHNRLDLWFPTCEEAISWGVKKIRGAVILPGRGPR